MVYKNKNGKYIVFELQKDRSKMIYVTKKGRKITVDRFYEVDTPYDSYENGVVSDPEKLQSVYQGYFLENPPKKAKAIFVIDADSIIERRMAIQKVKDKDIEGLLRYELEDYLSINMSDYVIQYKKLGTIKGTAEDIDEPDENVEGKKAKKNKVKTKLDLFVCAVPKNIIESYIEFAHELDLKIESIDVKSNVLSLYNTSSQNFNSGFIKPKKDTVCMLSISESRVDINLYDKGEYVYSTYVDHGINKLISELVKELGVSVSECFDMINRYNDNKSDFLKDVLANDDLFDEGFNPSQALEKMNSYKALFSRINKELDSLVSDISRSIAAQSSSNHLVVDKILLYSYYGQLKLVESIISNKFSDTKVAVVKRIDKVDDKKSCVEYKENVGSFVNLIGIFNK